MREKKDADRIAILARKWMEGAIIEEERAAFERWYASFEDAGPEILSDETPEALKERLYDAILRREVAQRQDNSGRIKPRKRYYRYLSGAACLIALAFISFWWMQNRFSDSPLVRIIKVRSGMEMHKTILPDGSIIWLKPGAALEHAASFADGRRVSLSGEALFEVAKDSLQPFTVLVGEYTATVLGTSFYIKQSDNRRDMELAVLTGKVSVGRNDNDSTFGTQLVLPNEKLLTGDKPSLEPFSETESKNYMAGTGYDMNFRDTPFAIVVARIEQKFEIVISGDLEQYASCRLSADLTDQGLDYTLELLAGSMGISYRVEGDTVFFEEGGCK